MDSLWIGGKWIAGQGPALSSRDPATGETVWEGASASVVQCDVAVSAAKKAFPAWAALPLTERIEATKRFAAILEAERDTLAETISRETGKLLAESRGEVSSMINKVALSIAAQAERAGTRTTPQPFGQAVLRHRPHGVMAVLGPYNFPGHLPNGHIIPALLAGNTVVFKPSEKTPMTGQFMAKAWEKTSISDGVFNLVQGERDTGAVLANAEIDGLLFTGSANAGMLLRRTFIDRPHVILALELGGNNPLVVWNSPEKAADLIIRSAFITTGQRCSCVRRLIIPQGRMGEHILDALIAKIDTLRIAAWNDPDDAFAGPLIDEDAARKAGHAARRQEGAGGKVLRPLAQINGQRETFVRPGLIDMTEAPREDTEIFAPWLQVVRVRDFSAAIAEANTTRFGLAAGLVSTDPAQWQRFHSEVRAGIINWNRPTTGASGAMPFGGLGLSGNHRPGAWYAADYCAWPVASFESAAP